MSSLLQNELFAALKSAGNKDDSMWEKLYTKQLANLQDKAYPLFLDNIKKLDLPTHNLPDVLTISEQLKSISNWQIEPVSGLIPYDNYFDFLSRKKFPCVNFIRSSDEENLSKDPDIFHELFGHCTMLVSQDYGDFLEEFAKFALTVKKIDQPLFARLIWFTTETGLIHTTEGLRIFGSSILSSFAESNYCLSDRSVIKKEFNVIDIFREPYRADMMQKVYYLIDSPSQVYSLMNDIPGLYAALKTARKLGESPARFPIEYSKYTNIGHCNMEELEPTDFATI